MIELRNAKTSTITNAIKKNKEALIRKNYNKIYAHEAAHKSAAGELGGSIHIVTNNSGIPVGGFVSISVPQVPETKNLNILDKTINKAKKVIKAALAPNDPSPADFAVSNQAKNTIEKVQDKKHKINHIA